MAKKLIIEGEATYVKQQREFIEELRENFERSERLRIETKRPPEQVAQLLRDLCTTLLGAERFALGQDVELCNDCNQPFTELNAKVAFGADENHVVVHPDDKVCEQCTTKRLERLNNAPTIGIP